jgi:hypothetical protein
MKLKTGTSTFLLFLFLCSCQEELDFFDPGFTKVYGLDGQNEGKDMIEAENGDLIMIGGFSRAFYLDNDETDAGGYIIRTDANGTQLNFRNFYFTRGMLLERANEYKNQLGLPDLNGDAVINGEGFQFVRELKNGNFFVVGNAYGTIGGEVFDFFDYFFILNPDFEPIKFQFFHNSQLEIQSLPGGRYFTNRGPKPILMDNGDMLLFAGDLWQDYFTPISGYSIYRIKEDGEFGDIWDFSLKDGVDLNEWVLDGQNNVIIYGAYSDQSPEAFATEGTTRDNDIILYKIDLTTGTQLKEVQFGKGHYNLAWRGGIQATSNGFVMSDYHIDTIGGNNLDPDQDGFRNAIGGLWFVDNNLDSLGKVHLTDDVVNQLAGRLVKTNDGGFVTSYFLRFATGDQSLVVKTDELGNVLWEYTMENTLYGSPLTVIETRDGGIVLWGRRDFNSMGQRSTLIKLSADGKL